MKSYTKKGITLIEALIVIVILVIIIGVLLPGFQRMREGQVIKSAMSDVSSAIDKARSQSLSSIDSSEYGIHFDSDQVVIFKGTTYTDGDINNLEIDVTAPATISSITLSGGGSDIYFDRLTGEPSKTGTVSITTNSFSRTITISATGTVSTN